MSDHLNEEQQNFLLRLAREAIERKLETGETMKAKTSDPLLLAKRGAFVTLKSGERLRGCIGYPLPYEFLAETIIDSAIMAATQDYRFEPITIDELPNIHIEISVLSRPRPAEDYREVEVGTHGIIISKGHNRGLLLPQVPLEYGWNRETYLGHGCLKAGLDEDEWKKGAKIEIFSAQVFSEPKSA